MKRISLFGVLVGALLVVVLAGCAAPAATPTTAPTAMPPVATGVSPAPTSAPPAATAKPPAPTAVPPTQAPAAQKESVLIIGIGTATVLLDPQKTTNWNDYGVYDNIYERLYYRKKDASLVPQLAVSSKQIDDLTWEFKLREGVKFSNGEPFNANSVKVTIEKMLDPNEKTTMTAYFGIISKVQVVDDYTVRLVTKTPDPLMLARLGGYGGCIIPPKYLDQVGRTEFAAKPVGTGPYKLESWTKDGDLVLVRNKDYWGQPGPFDKVIYRPIPEAGARVAALIKGEIDYAKPVLADQVDSIQKSGNKIAQGPTTSLIIYTICWNACEAPILRNPQFRQALNLAVDRQSIVKDLYRGFAMMPNGYISATDWGYDPKAPPLEYNPEKAKKLISESGYKGEPIIIYTTTNDVVPGDKALSETVAAMLKAVGINVDLRSFDTANRDAMSANKTVPGIYVNNPSSPMLDMTSQVWRHLRPGAPWDFGYADTNKVWVDAMTASETELDQAKRLALIKKANQALLDNPPWLVVFQQVFILGLGPKAFGSEVRSDNRIMIEDFAPPK